MKKSLNRLIPSLSLSLACAALLPLASAQAAPVSFDWKATATANSTAYGVHIGDILSGTISYDIGTAS